MSGKMVSGPSGDVMAALVGDTLGRVAKAEEALALERATSPDWSRIQALMGQSPTRRTGRAGRLVVVGAALAVALVGVGVLTGVPSGLFQQASPSTDQKDRGDQASGGYSSLYGQPVRGSLKADAAFLAGVQQRLAGPDLYENKDLLRGYVPQAGTFKIIFAGDVGEFRLVLAEGSWTNTDMRPARGPEPVQIWLEGPADATPAQLVAGDLRPSGSAPAYVARGPESAPNPRGQTHGPSAVVVVSATPVTVRLVTGDPVIGADGSISLPGTALGDPADGVYQAPLPLRHQEDLQRYVEVFVDGRLAAVSPSVGRPWAPAGPNLKITHDQGQPLRGGETWPEKPEAVISPRSRSNMIVSFAWSIADATMVTRSSGTFQMLAAAPPLDDSDQTGRSLVGAYTLPGGGRVVAARAYSMRGEEDGHYGIAVTMAAKVVPPSVPASHLSLVWVQKDALTALGRAGTTPGWSGAMGPAGTTRVEWVHAGGSTTTSPATNTLATTHSIDITAARFFDASGRLLGQEPVSPGPVEGASGQLIPELAAALRS